MRFKFYKLICGVLWVAFLLWSAAACGRPQGQETGQREGVTFTDALGRAVTVPREPKRVAALLGSFADVWVLAGGELCAAAEDAWEDFGLTPEGAVNLGGAHSPGQELLISTAPDFVIASASTASHLAMRDTLEALGIPVAYFDVDHFEDYLGMLDICTDLTGCKDLYEKNGLSLQKKINEIKESYVQADIPEEERRILLLRASATSVKAKGSEGTILGEMLADMGCVNIADREGSLLENLSPEAVIRWEPHHIFVVTMGSNTQGAEEALRTMISENPAWGSLTAVKEGRLHVMDKKLFNLKPNARWGEAYDILYEKLKES